jgi:hypothetical protein
MKPHGGEFYNVYPSAVNVEQVYREGKVCGVWAHNVLGSREICKYRSVWSKKLNGRGYLEMSTKTGAGSRRTGTNAPLAN